MTRTVGLLLGAALLFGAARARADVFSVNGFEGYDIGSIAGQSLLGGPGGPPTWQNFSAPGQLAPIIEMDPTGANRGKVLNIQPTGTNSGDYSGAFLPLGDLVAGGASQINIAFDQYRVPMAQELYIGENAEEFPTGWDAREHGLSTPPGRLYPTDDLLGSPWAQLTPSVWQHVEFNLDYSTQLVTASLDGTAIGPTHFETLNPTFRGLALYAFATSRPPNQGPNLFDNITVTTNTGGAIPEPASLALLATGLLPLLRRRKA